MVIKKSIWGLIGFLALFSCNVVGESNVHLRGVVVPKKHIKVGFARPGLLVFLKEAGTSVNKGDLLAKIDPTKAKAELAQARASQGSAQAELDAALHNKNKSARLVKENILSDIALIEAEFSVKTAMSKVEVAKSKVAVAQLAVDECELHAPFSGVVANTTLSVDEWTKAGDPIVEIADPSELVLTLDLPPKMAEVLAVGQETNVLLNGAVVANAKVLTIFPIIEPTSGLRRVKWKVNAQKSILLSGRYVELQAW